MAFEQRFEGGKGEFYSSTFGNTHPFHIYLSKGPVPDANSWDAFASFHDWKYTFSWSPWRTLLFSWTVCFHILVFLLRHMFSFTHELWEMKNQSDKDNLRLIDCRSLCLNSTQPPSPPDNVLILTIDISQHPFIPSNQTAAYTPLPHRNTTFHA